MECNALTFIENKKKTIEMYNCEDDDEESLELLSVDDTFFDFFVFFFFRLLFFDFLRASTDESVSEDFDLFTFLLLCECRSSSFFLLRIGLAR